MIKKFLKLFFLSNLIVSSLTLQAEETHKPVDVTKEVAFLNNQVAEYVTAWDTMKDNSEPGIALAFGGLKGAFYITAQAAGWGWNSGGASVKGNDAAIMTMAMLKGATVGFLTFILTLPLMPVTGSIGAVTNLIKSRLDKYKAEKITVTTKESYQHAIQALFGIDAQPFYKGDLATSFVAMTKKTLNIADKTWLEHSEKINFSNYFPKELETAYTDRTVIHWVNNTSELLLKDKRISFTADKFQQLLSSIGAQDDFRKQLLVYGHVYLLAKHYYKLSHSLNTTQYPFDDLVAFAFAKK